MKTGADKDKGGSRRAGRVGEALRDELAMEVRALSDPRLAGVIVTRVEIDPDLQRAKVFVRHELGAPEPSARRDILRGFHAASGRLRREMGRRVKLRTTPELVFLYDEAPDEQRRIEELLHEIKEEDAKRGSGAGGAPSGDGG